MNIQQLDIKAIRPYENNPRKNDKAVATVVKSLEEYGFQQPIVVDKDMSIIVGHTRYRAAKQLGYTTVPVIVADTLTPKQVTAYRIMDNRSNENARWDDTMLLDELKQLLDHDPLATVSEHTGFTEAQLNKMFPDTVEDDLIDSYIKPEFRSRTGDVWILGDHRLINGDSTKPEDIQALMLDDTIDLFWEDPPYGIAYESIGAIAMSQRQRDERIHKIANDNLSPKQLDAFLHAHLQACSPFVKSGAAVYWCHDIRFTQQFRDLLVAHNFHISDTLIWKKNGSSNHMANYAKFYEPILYGWKSGSEHQWHGTWSPNVIELDRLEDLSQEQLIEIIKNIPSNVQYFDREPKATGRLHPTVKPTKLVAYHIMNSSRIGDIVFDGFAGSGAALLAAEKTGRRARCVEFEPKFCDVIIQRWQELTGLQATRESDGVKWDDITTEAAIYTPQLSNVFSNLSTVFDIERVSNVQLTL